MKIFIQILTFFVFSVSIFSQPDSIFPIKTYPFDLGYDTTHKLIDSSKIHKPVCSNPSFIYKVKKVLSFTDSSLVIQKGSKKLKLNMNDVKSVKFYKGTRFLKGMSTGAMLGLSSMLWLYSISGDSSFSGAMAYLTAGILLSIPGAIIGGIVGLFFEDSHIYNLTGLSAEKKKTKLYKLFRKYKMQ